MEQATFREALIEDLKVWNIPVGENTSFLRLLKHTIYSLIFYPGFACVFFYRLNRSLNKRSNLLARLMSVWRFYQFGNDISFYAEIGPGFKINHVTDIVVGTHVKIGCNCSIYNGVTLGAKRATEGRAQPTVGDHVFIGTGAKILGPIKIGNHVTIGALSFCDKSVPDNVIAFGIPIQIKSQNNL